MTEETFDEVIADAAANLDGADDSLKRYIDEQTGDRLIVTKVTDKQADEYRVTFDHEKNPVTVADFSGNEAYPDDDTVVEAEYESDREQYDDPKTYAFPISRLAYPKSSEDNDDDEDEDELPSGEPFKAEELPKLTGQDDDEDGRLGKTDIDTRHYFIGRSRATTVPRRVRNFTLVSHASSNEEAGDYDLLYESDGHIVRVTRDSPDSGDYVAISHTEDGKEELGAWSRSSRAISAITRRMARFSGTLDGDAL